MPTKWLHTHEHETLTNTGITRASSSNAIRVPIIITRQLSRWKQFSFGERTTGVVASNHRALDLLLYRINASGPKSSHNSL